MHALVAAGHEVVVEDGAGAAAGCPDDAYRHAGARLAGVDEVWDSAELVLKVKQPVGIEFSRLHEGQMLFTYLHLAADRAVTEALLESGTTAIAYEDVRAPDGSLPLLTPMSVIAGRLSGQIAAHELMAPRGGSGILLGGVPGVRPGHVVVLGGGVVGSHAARMAVGLSARVTVVDANVRRLGQLDDAFQGAIETRYSTPRDVAELLEDADAVIGSVLVPGARSPKLVTDEMVARMRPGAVLVDVAIDQGGCFEGSHPTTHSDPTYRVHDALFYCVPNMPGAVPVTATAALSNATLPYVLRLAELGWRDAARLDPGLAAGIVAHAGSLTSSPVGAAHHLPWEGVGRLIGR